MSAVLVYLGILAGIFFEGEMTMISSVIAGHKGYLNLSIVIALGITGTIASDVVYFFLGRKKGEPG
jgi:membrane protein DedA with SNARE-associated domain